MPRNAFSDWTPNDLFVYTRHVRRYVRCVVIIYSGGCLSPACALHYRAAPSSCVAVRPVRRVTRVAFGSRASGHSSGVWVPCVGSLEWRLGPVRRVTRVAFGSRASGHSSGVHVLQVCLWYNDDRARDRASVAQYDRARDRASVAQCLALPRVRRTGRSCLTDSSETRAFRF